MKAVVMTETGGTDVLKVQQLPDPAIRGKRDLLIKVKAAGVNPVDTKLRRHGTYFPESRPTVLGCDGAGVVVESGSEAKRFRRGDEVYYCNGGIGGPNGNYAEYTVIDERFVARKPASLGFAQAAAAPLVLLTAWESLHDRGRVQPGRRALVHAGAGGVGHVAVQLARIAGARVCSTVGSEEKAKLVSYLGAERPILYKSVDFVKECLDWSEGEGVDLAIDTVGGQVFQKTFPSVRVYGDLVTLLKPGSDTDWTTARTRNLRISLEIMLTPMILGLEGARVHQAEILEKCAVLIDDAKLEILLTKTFPLDEAASAHRFVEKGSTTGKIALTIEE